MTTLKFICVAVTVMSNDSINHTQRNEHKELRVLKTYEYEVVMKA